MDHSMHEHHHPHTDAQPPRWNHPACLPVEELLEQCRFTTGRTSGPGGQNRNKVETAVEVVHEPTGVIAQASERRSQKENRQVAITRLRLNLAVHVRRSVPTGDIGSALWRSRRRDPPKDSTAGSPPKGRWTGGGTGLIVVNPNHEDYPALLAEALDVVAACRWDARRASLRLECSASQLIKLVKDHPAALAMWNQHRIDLGLHTLK